MRMVTDFLGLLQSFFDNLVELYLLIDPHRKEGAEVQIEQLVRVAAILHGE